MKLSQNKRRFLFFASFLLTPLVLIGIFIFNSEPKVDKEICAPNESYGSYSEFCIKEVSPFLKKKEIRIYSKKQTNRNSYTVVNTPITYKDKQNLISSSFGFTKAEWAEEGIKIWFEDNYVMFRNGVSRSIFSMGQKSEKKEDYASPWQESVNKMKNDIDNTLLNFTFWDETQKETVDCKSAGDTYHLTMCSIRKREYLEKEIAKAESEIKEGVKVASSEKVTGNTSFQGMPWKEVAQIQLNNILSATKGLYQYRKNRCTLDSFDVMGGTAQGYASGFCEVDLLRDWLVDLKTHSIYQHPKTLYYPAE
jgi:hypothetical protein